MSSGHDERVSPGCLSGVIVAHPTKDLVADPAGGRTIAPKQRLDEVMAAAKLADEAGLDMFTLGEHHRRDIGSCPIVVLSAWPCRSR